MLGKNDPVKAEHLDRRHRAIGEIFIRLASECV
jgi:hypothetical protein